MRYSSYFGRGDRLLTCQVRWWIKLKSHRSSLWPESKRSHKQLQDSVSFAWRAVSELALCAICSSCYSIRALGTMLSFIVYGRNGHLGSSKACFSFHVGLVLAPARNNHLLIMFYKVLISLVCRYARHQSAAANSIALHFAWLPPGLAYSRFWNHWFYALNGWPAHLI